MKVLYVIDSLGSGGAETSLTEMLPRLRRDGIEVSIALLRSQMDGTEEWVRATGYRVEVLSGGTRSAQLLSLRRRLRAESPALLHTTLYEADILGRLAAWRTGIPVLTSLVNTTYDPIRLRDPHVSRIGLWWARTLDGWTARHLTCHFHAITQAVKEAAVRDLGLAPERIDVIERGRDAERLGRRTEERRSRVRAGLGLSEDDEVMIHVGRQEFQKGQRYLLEAIDRLGDDRPKLVTVLVGRAGHATDDLRRTLARSRFRDRVRVLGYREDVPDILAAADLFVFPSLYEGLGGALIEAMALGLPIVASDLPACREVVEEGGNALLVEPGSAGALAVGCRRLLEAPDLAARFGRRSREIFESRFRLETAASRMTALYRRLSDGGKRERPSTGHSFRHPIPDDQHGKPR